MEKISSFKINHLKLIPGIYVARYDYLASVITTFDLRITRPNFEAVMGTGAIHAFEHLGATFLRNDLEYKEKIIYFGPMGCRTGFYLIIAGDYKSKNIVSLVTRMIEFISNYTGAVPGATSEDCGNYLDMDLDRARHYAKKFKEEVLDNLTPKKLNYPLN